MNILNLSLEEKVNLYNRCKELYYTGDKESPLTDIEFDELEKELGLENKGYIGTHHQKSYTVKHPFIMGSLSKIQVKFDKDNTIHFEEYIPQIKSYLNKSYGVNRDDWYFEITPKYDGCSFEAVIDRDLNLVSVSTRGDGEFGKDIKPWFEKEFENNIEPYLKDFSLNNFDDQSWFFLDKLVFRGECLIKKSVFKEKYLGDFKMPRSFVAGCIAQDWKNTPKQIEIRNDLCWVYYDIREIYENESIIELDYSGYMDDKNRKYIPTYSYLNIPGFKPNLSDGSMMICKYSDIGNFDNIYKAWEEYRKNCEFELDGFVIKPCAVFRLQDRTRTRQEDCVAIKFTPDIVDTNIIDIEWNVGKTGEYYPTGILEPVEIGGKIVSRVSLANYDTSITKKTGIGSKIKVSLAGDIIPFVIDVIEPSDILNIPNDSYIVENKNGLHLMKEMTDKEQMYVKFLNSVNVLKPDGIGEKVAKKLFEIYTTDNIVNLMTFPKLWHDQLDDSKSSQNIRKSLEERKKTLTLPDYIQSLGIENCGEKNSLWLAQKLSGLRTDSKGIPTSIIELSKDSEFCMMMMNRIELIGIPLLTEKKNENKIPVILTGSPKPTYNTKKEFLANFSQFVETTNWDECQILITDDINSTSSKMTKAKKKGIPIKTYLDF